MGRMQSDPSNVPPGYDEKNPLGRPKEKLTDRDTQDNAFGKDRLGAKGMKKDYNDNGKLKQDFKGGSPLALETKNMLDESQKKNHSNYVSIFFYPVEHTPCETFLQETIHP